MLFRADETRRPIPLKPFVFKTNHGYLLGNVMAPNIGSPCSNCVEMWMKDRNVDIERIELSELPIRRDLIGDLIAENNPHVLYEIDKVGGATRIDGAVFPHPQCNCDRSKYVAPQHLDQKTNFTFSPIHQLKCARFGTPSGNLWLTSALGNAPLAGTSVSAFGVSSDRETSRLKAVQEWLKKSVSVDAPYRLSRQDQVMGEIFQTGQAEPWTPSPFSNPSTEILGSGGTKEEATLDALFSLAKMRTLRRYASSGRNPMLIVGTNNWLRQRVPFFMLQQYDLHCLFYPNSMHCWVVGIAAFSRMKTDEKPIFVFGADSAIGAALDQAIGKILEICRPSEWSSEEEAAQKEKEKEKGLTAEKIAKLNVWWTHWVYRCAKISLKDVLHLEPYARDLESWKNFFRDGEAKINVIPMNSTLFPSEIRHLIRLDIPGEMMRPSSNVNGIGTLSALTANY